MFAKIEITGTLEVVTGLHIGGSSAFAAIGAVDSPVIKDNRTGDPILPGSSLKGKMRSLLAKKYNEKVAKNPNEDAECIRNLFGNTANGRPRTGRLLFSDMYLTEENKEELRKYNIVHPVEVKFENTINRATAVANPRQIERVIRGAEFGLNLVYETPAGEEKGQILEDAVLGEKIIDEFRLLCDGLRLMKYDYLGGSGSRGYGKVTFKDLQADVVVGDVEDAILDACNELLAQV